MWDQLVDIWASIVASTPRLTVAVATLVFTWVVASLGSRLLRRGLARTKMRASLQDLLRQLTYAAVWIAGLLVSANVAFPTLTPGKTLTALGIGSIAIGFAFKDIFENFFAGILILWRFPFENGDYIRCGDMMGKVEETTIRMTLVRQVDGRLLVVPNARLFKDPVEVLTSDELARIEVTVGIAYAEDIDQARKVIADAVKEQPTVASSRPVDVQVSEFNSSSVDFRVLWWTGSEPAARREATDQVLTAVKRALDDAGIEIPFPYRTLTLGRDVPEQLNNLLGE
ncbi:MAG: mechanosensitive ion channel [Planctomycetes bacterium]|nr:mechanosensitive ion channel [Planctomycetota bacterium]